MEMENAQVWSEHREFIERLKIGDVVEYVVPSPPIFEESSQRDFIRRAVVSLELYDTYFRDLSLEDYMKYKYRIMDSANTSAIV